VNWRLGISVKYEKFVLIVFNMEIFVLFPIFNMVELLLLYYLIQIITIIESVLYFGTFLSTWSESVLCYTCDRHIYLNKAGQCNLMDEI